MKTTLTNPNDAAFATQSVYDENGVNQEIGSFGLSKLEYFYAAAIQGLLANPNAQEIFGIRDRVTYESTALSIAKDMIYELNKEVK